MFGFAELASFAYFEHLVRAIEDRFRTRGLAASVRVCEVHPTASVCRRAATLARMIASTTDGDEPIHIVGHSTGGLDARLVASPSVSLPGLREGELAFAPRIRSVTTMNTPHHGTPLAAFFATVSGQRLLYAVSALTVTALKLGAPPLAAASALVAAIGRLQVLGGLEFDLVERTVDGVLRVLDEASSRELRAWLRQLRDDQGAIVQLMPEAMDLFQAGVEDRPHVRYQCVATYAPSHAVADWLAVRTPWAAMSGAIFTALYNLTARHDPRYPCAPPDGRAEVQLRSVLGELPPITANDGVVPLYSQIWGELIWAGRGDHLDVVGHFPGSGGHTDWLSSGARFTQVRFDRVIDVIVAGMLRAEEEHAARGRDEPIAEPAQS